MSALRFASVMTFIVPSARMLYLGDTSMSKTRRIASFASCLLTIASASQQTVLIDD